MRPLAWLLLFSLAACGSTRPTRTTEIIEEDRPPVADVAATDGGDEAAAGEDEVFEAGAGDEGDAPPAVAGDAVVERLREAAEAALPAEVEAIDVDSLRRALEDLATDEPAYGWAALRVGRVLAHQRRFREAREVLAAARDGATGDAAEGIGATLRRLEARDRVVASRLGVLLPLSGPYGAIGQSALAAIKIAVPAGSGVELVVADTAGDADRAAKGVEKLVLEDGVAAIVGPVGSIESEAAALTAERFEVPIMVLSSAEGLTDLGTFVFRHRVTRTAQARAIARYAVEEMGFRRFAFLYPRSDYGREMMTAFWETVEGLGGEIRGAQAYPLHWHDFHTPIKKLVGRYHLEARTRDRHWEKLNRKARDPALHVPPIVDFEAVFIPDGGDRARMALSFLRYWDVELKTDPEMDPRLFRRKYGGVTPQLVQVLAGNGFNDPRFAERVGELAHNSVFVDALPPGGGASAFAGDYEAATGRRPGSLAYHAHDAARLRAEAVRGRADRDAVRRHLLAARDVEGALGLQSVQGDGAVHVPLQVLTIHPELGIVPREQAWADEPPPGDEDAPPSN